MMAEDRLWESGEQRIRVSQAQLDPQNAQFLMETSDLGSLPLRSSKHVTSPRPETSFAMVKPQAFPPGEVKERLLSPPGDFFCCLGESLWTAPREGATYAVIIVGSWPVSFWNGETHFLATFGVAQC